jgi:hypothetical protein
VLPRDHHVELSEPLRTIQMNLYLEKPPEDYPKYSHYERIIAEADPDADSRTLESETTGTPLTAEPTRKSAFDAPLTV